LAPSTASILITGETGTGKELVARAIHDMSPRRAGPYLPINCASFPEALVEAELFGYERGAFTGADRNRTGCFELANGGTLLLDELTEMKFQAKLLRVLEERRLRRVGGTTEIPIDVRVIAASNRDIEQAVHDGLLRADLYYRLSVFTIRLPPLRKRIEDIPLLVHMFIKQYAARYHKNVDGIDETCMKELQANPWPGNVRELRNVIERALIICEGHTICANDLSDLSQIVDVSATNYINVLIGSSLEAAEKEIILRTIEFARGNKTRAAKALGVSVKTLYNKLNHYLGGLPGEVLINNDRRAH
jgi:transcriptional regulator with PAS, ATPase and Fis domain